MKNKEHKRDKKKNKNKCRMLTIKTIKMIAITRSTLRLDIELKGKDDVKFR